MRTDRFQSTGAVPDDGFHSARGLCAALAVGAAVALLAVVPRPGAAQTTAEAPTVRSLLTGYGAVGYRSTLEGSPTRNNFSSFISLVPIARIHDDIFVEGEVEVELHGSETQVVLEHAEITYTGFERVLFKAGKFHLPIGVWMHTNWTNKMPTPPLLYEDTHGDAATNGLMPIPFDLGAMATWTPEVADGWRTSASVWVSQGPVDVVGGGHTHEEGEEEPEPGGAADADAPLLGIGANNEDNNADKMVGGMVRAASMGGLTLQASAWRAAYDAAGDLATRGGNFGIVWEPREGAESLFQLKAEGTVFDQEYLVDGSVETIDYSGYYVQLSKRLGPWEPVARWSRLSRTTAGAGVLVPKRRQLAVGLNYWISPSVPVKASYEYEPDGTDRLFIEWAMGF